jgi:hypothetical protein
MKALFDLLGARAYGRLVEHYGARVVYVPRERYDAFVSAIGKQATRRVVQEFGGQEVRLADVEHLQRKAERIRAAIESGGYQTLSAVAAACECSERWVRAIAKEVRHK